MHPCTATFRLHDSPGAKARISTVTQKKTLIPWAPSNLQPIETLII
jgi:hypothetical protein